MTFREPHVEFVSMSSLNTAPWSDPSDPLGEDTCSGVASMRKEEFCFLMYGETVSDYVPINT